DAGRADHAAGRDQAVLLGGGVEVEPGGAAAGASDASVGIDLDVPHPGQVDDQAIVDRAVPGGVVGSSPHRHLWAVLLAERRGRRPVVGVDAARDRGGLPDDQQVEAKAGLVVLGVAWYEDVALQGLSES